MRRRDAFDTFAATPLLAALRHSGVMTGKPQVNSKRQQATK
jgi:hypothetical protein